jgi:molecular chaperone HscB
VVTTATDPFEVMGLEPRFDLDRAVLDKQHRELGRALHPDRYAQAGASERRQALSRAIDVNEAYRRLKDPLSRADALLVRLGLAAAEAPASPAFLMQILEAREALADAARDKDVPRIAALGREYEARAEGLVGSLAQAFELAASAAADSGVSLALTQTLSRGVTELRYVQRFVEETRALLDELE